MSLPTRNVRTREFKAREARLPESIRALADAAFRTFLANPRHPALRLHPLKDTDRGQHRPGSISVSINRQYGAIYVPDGSTNVWYWIGSHNDYDQFTGRV